MVTYQHAYCVLSLEVKQHSCVVQCQRGNGMSGSQRTSQKLMIPTVSAIRIKSMLACTSEHKLKADIYRAFFFLSVLYTKPTGSTFNFSGAA